MTDRKSLNENSISKNRFTVLETTISKIHHAIKRGIITCRLLTKLYTKRIKTYDQPTRLNSIVIVNINALKIAEKLDKEYRTTGKLRPLHGIPIIIKDNYNTKDMQTTAGSIALKDFIPPEDAYQVRALREAGAVIFAKSNMAEWAFSPYQTVSSITGTTRNPYDLTRVPAGSSGGTAAAVAANLGAVGLGTDTGNSIRGPSAHTCLVGIRSTMGLISRNGIIPLYLRNDLGGPITRTVEDAARILDIVAGYDAADPITKHSRGKIPRSYTTSLQKDGLNGARIGVFRYFTDQPTADSQIRELFNRAIEDMASNGAEIVDPFEIPDFENLSNDLWCETFKFDLEDYLSAWGKKIKYKKLEEIVASGLYSPYIKERLKKALDIEDRPRCKDLYNEPRNIEFRETILKSMSNNGVDIFIYPTWNNPPRLIGDLDSPAGDNSQRIPPHTGLPGLTLPMGFTYNTLPAGLQIVGGLFGEPEIIKIAYAFEQITKYRTPPKLFL